MRKFFVIFAFLFSIVLVGQTEKIEPGQLIYRAQENGTNYRISLHALQPSPALFTIKAIKVTYEPSGTIVLAVFDAGCTNAEKSAFTDKKTPLAIIDTTITEVAPSVVVPFPDQIANDNLVKVEYLIESDGTKKTMLVSAASIESTEVVGFSSVILEGGGGGIRHCCTCGACQPCCITCNTPYFTCCCAAGTITCGIVKCPGE